MNTQNINEAAGALAGLPKHWIKFLVARHGKEYGQDMAGEHSKTTRLKGGINPGWIKHALKDPNNMAVIGRKDGQPIFMIAKHENKTTRFRFFEVEKSEGNYDSKGSSYRTGGRRRGHYVTSDSFTIAEVIDIIDKMMTDQAFEDLYVESITKDPERDTRRKYRSELRGKKEDPLAASKNYYGEYSQNVATRERAKKYSAMKKPIIDAKVDAEVQKIKDQVASVLDGVLKKIVEDAKRGYTHSVTKSTLASNLANALDISGLSNIAAAYSAVKTDYSSDKPHVMAKNLKKTGLA